MPLLSVIIPFYQRETGILSRALHSVRSQHLPDDWIVEIIIVDDSSPVSAQDEVRGIELAESMRLRIIVQENGGAGAARNRGLDEVGSSGTLIAFLDSDDMWPASHLVRAIEALDNGFDFYFTDNRREGHHESHFHSPFLAQTATFLDQSPQRTGLLEIPRDLMIGLTLSEFPCQASTVVYRRSIIDGLRFDTDLRHSGEDVLFFACLIAAAKRVCIDLDSMVQCGGGINIYFSNLDWNSKKHLSIKVDSLVTRRRIAERLSLSDRNREWNNDQIAECRGQLAFHILRNAVQHPAVAAREMFRLARMAPGAAIVVPFDVLGLVGHKLFNLIDKKKHERRS
jgi:succinoglycan biosynthesis protein ExoW